MRIVRAGDATRFQNAASCIAYEYDTHDTDSNIARIEISGRYPLQGSAVNTAVKELVYVESGEGTITVDAVLTSLTKGDVLSIEKGEAVVWDGMMTLIIACTPAWTAEQYRGIP